MIEDQKFNISQDHEIVLPQKGKAYPISVNEWIFIKDKVNEIKVEANRFHSIGSLLVGGALSCLITILSQEDPLNNPSWPIFGVCVIGGGLSWFFAYDKNKQENKKPKDITEQMDLIEARFESTGE